ncbi:hypothetical protein Y032_0135g1941 [Ancylostoma ceylanicum]|uniref:SEA domain-containing protein n=1 Tax=Ancylostoma ceylanicum TaxID=53326 RepID=A0A016T5U9_9BILA|nr:hypothetical protein Y032_0135g1941 [Ancylostoma ceylanicum]
MRSSSCIPVVLFLLFCLSSAKESANPQCSPISGSGTESAIDFIFLLDHSLGADKVSRVQYLYKAISCEIPISKQYRLATVHVPGKSSKVDLAGWQTSAAFPDTLFRGSRKGSTKELCDVLDEAIKTVKSYFASSASKLGQIPIHFVVPVTKKSGCNIESVFRKHFGRDKHRSNIFLDIIAIEIPMEIGDVGVRVKVPSWHNIETKVISLTTYVNFEDIYKMDSVLQQYSGWIKSTLQGLQINDVFLLDDTTPNALATEEGKVKVKIVDPLTTTSKKASKKQTLPPKTTRVRTAREVSADNFVPPLPLNQRRARVSVPRSARLTTVGKQRTKKAVPPKAATTMDGQLTGAAVAKKASKTKDGQPAKVAVALKASSSADEVPAKVAVATKASAITDGLPAKEAVATKESTTAHKQPKKVAAATVKARKTGKPAVHQDGGSQAIDDSARYAIAPWDDHPETRNMAKESWRPKWKRLANADLEPSGDDQYGDPSMQDHGSAVHNSPGNSSTEHASSSGTKWNRTFIPLLILIIILALILIFILICCLFLIEAEKDFQSSMRNSLEKNDALIIRSSDLSRAPERFRCSNATKSNRENAYNQLRNKSAWP